MLLPLQDIVRLCVTSVPECKIIYNVLPVIQNISLATYFLTVHIYPCLMRTVTADSYNIRLPVYTAPGKVLRVNDCI